MEICCGNLSCKQCLAFMVSTAFVMKQIHPRSNYSGTKSRTKNLHESLTLAQRGCSFGRRSALQHIGCYLKVEMCAAHGLKVLTGSFNLSKCSCSQRLLAGNPSYPCQKKQTSCSKAAFEYTAAKSLCLSCP